jgi:hypothetical protein
MRAIQVTALSLLTLLVIGCAPTPIKPVAIEAQFYEQKTQKVGVYLDTLPEVNTFFPGAGCLLCLAAAEIANSDVTDHVKTLSVEDIESIAADVETALKAKGLQPVIISSPINWDNLEEFKTPDELKQYARKDLRPLKQPMGVDKLVVVDINQVGVIRSYSSYVPTSDPMGYLYGEVAIVDLNDNSYKMYQSVNIKTAVVGEWDEPENFPGITTAFYESINTLKQKVMSLLKPSDPTVATAE